MSYRKKVSQHWALLVPLVGLLELAAYGYFVGRAPRLDDYPVLGPAVAELRQDGDLITVAPHWAEPMVRRALGDGLMPLRDIGRGDMSRYQTALEISILGQHDPQLNGWRELSRREQDGFVLRRLSNPGVRPVLVDFVEQLSPPVAQVSLSGVPCPFKPSSRVLAGGLGGHPTFPQARFQCRGRFFNAGVTVIADESFRPRRCIWAHPPRKGALTVRYGKVDLGSVIQGHGGMYWIIERERKGAPVELTVKVDGEPVGTYVHHDGDGWSDFEMPLGDRAGSRGATVEFAVSSSSYRHRHFCFEATSR